MVKIQEAIGILKEYLSVCAEEDAKTIGRLLLMLLHGEIGQDKLEHLEVQRPAALLGALETFIPQPTGLAAPADGSAGAAADQAPPTVFLAIKKKLGFRTNQVVTVPVKMRNSFTPRQLARHAGYGFLSPLRMYVNDVEVSCADMDTVMELTNAELNGTGKVDNPAKISFDGRSWHVAIVCSNGLE